ncbi:MAG: efflux RND transporter periplasmic adaptor subunit [Gammaproteobacteria bacterium]|nr:efflux RND transporter periplasmic adaptor subunit [Gammaproteobacteria bacterium]MBT5604207.1 efflux RND transporter periplasmic adaptor subunit [Gammaproteobacteria bacterium]MBT6244372.1 efflux RND transporter periplasmic adaptor subunit [Gammaproteobacteria bacterium]
MNDKKALLGELSINDAQRDSSNPLAVWMLVVIIAVAASVSGWFWFASGEQPVLVNLVRAEPAGQQEKPQGETVLDASGYVTARRQATVSSKFTGKVMEVFIEEGVYVEANQLLARLDNSTQLAQYNLIKSQLKASQSRLLEVEVQLNEAELQFTRTVQLSERQLASQSELDRADLLVKRLKARLASLQIDIEVGESSVQVQQQQLDDTEIRAPFAGVVIAKAAQPGEMISPISAGGGFTRTGICTIVDMQSLEIEVDVNESYINRVKPDQLVTATLNSYPDWKIDAKVITIIPTADRNKATVRVRIAFQASDSRILPDMGVKVSFMDDGPEVIQLPSDAVGVLIPNNSVVNLEGENVVFVVIDSIVEIRAVKVGLKQGNNRNILSGVQKGERVVIDVTRQLAEVLTEGQEVIVN